MAVTKEASVEGRLNGHWRAPPPREQALPREQVANGSTLQKSKDSLAENGVGDVSLTLRRIAVAVTYDSQQTVVLRDGGEAPSRDE